MLVFYDLIVPEGKLGLPRGHDLVEASASNGLGAVVAGKCLFLILSRTSVEAFITNFKKQVLTWWWFLGGEVIRNGLFSLSFAIFLSKQPASLQKLDSVCCLVSI